MVILATHSENDAGWRVLHKSAKITTVAPREGPELYGKCLMAVVAGNSSRLVEPLKFC
jgi:hypothetical protein